jgi:competence protein ComEC
MVKWGLIGLLLVVGTLRFGWWIHSQPKISAGDQVRLTLTVQALPIRVGQIFIYPHPGDQIAIGDRIEVTGNLGPRLIYGKQEGFTLKQAVITQLPKPFTFISGINSLRQVGIARISKSMPSDEAALGIGLLLGGNSSMSNSLLEAYRATGLMHIVAASGYNVTMAAAWIMVLVSRIVNRRHGIILGVAGIVLYVLLAGATAAVVRAGIMAILALIGLYWGRASDARWLLLITAQLMWVFKPDILTDIGFQLSFAATAGLVFLGPKGNLWTTLAAQISTLPLILHYFGSICLVAPLSNLAVLWAVPVGMQATVLVLILGSFGSWIAWPVLKYINAVVLWFASWPGAGLQINPVSWIWVVGYYSVLILVWIIRRRLLVH